jgi:hypothetical protein
MLANALSLLFKATERDFYHFVQEKNDDSWWQGESTIDSLYLLFML